MQGNHHREKPFGGFQVTDNRVGPFTYASANIKIGLMGNRPLALLKKPFKPHQYPKERQGVRYNGWMKHHNLWGFHCPNQNKLTMFREDRNPELFICTECGTHKRRKPLSGGYLRLKGGGYLKLKGKDQECET